MENKIPKEVSIIEYTDKVDEMYNNMPDKRTKEYKEWKKEYNDLVNKVNYWVEFKMLSNIK